MSNVTFDPYDLSLVDDPYPVYAALRADAPVYRSDGGGFWAFPRFADVKAALGDSETYCSSRGLLVIQATPDLFAKLFAGVKSFKRLAPGVIMTAPGETPCDPRDWILTHDASTLGGNSGSALADLDANGQTLLGLHFAGQHARQNWAYALERITPVLAPYLPPLAS